MPSSGINGQKIRHLRVGFEREVGDGMMERERERERERWNDGERFWLNGNLGWIGFR